MTIPRPTKLCVDEGGRGWRVTWRVVYAVVRRIDRITKAMVALDVPGYPDVVVERRLVGRKTGRRRPVLVGLSRVDDRMYVGHPSGLTAWLANLEAADAVPLLIPNRQPIMVHSTPLGLGAERDAVVAAAARQEPIPMRALFWASQRHSRRSGVYHRLDVVTGAGPRSPSGIARSASEGVETSSEARP